MAEKCRMERRRSWKMDRLKPVVHARIGFSPWPRAAVTLAESADAAELGSPVQFPTNNTRGKSSASADVSRNQDG